MNYKLFPKIKPYTEGYLKVSDIHTLHYEECGNPRGKPVIFLHGGPGLGIIPEYRQFFDPKFYRIILLDQRGSGKSTPFADMRENTTWHLVEDLEKLRIHLKIQKWLVTGGSWGSMLALAYAVKHPNSVKGIIIRGVCLGREKDNNWLMKEGGASEIWPDKWEEFVSIIPKNKRDNIPKAYLELLNSKDKKIREKAAISFSSWEDTIKTLIPKEENWNAKAIKQAVSFSKTESYYDTKNFFVDKKIGLLKDINKIKNIPLIMVQGRYDTICPMRSAWDIHKALPKSKLIIVPTGAHSPLEPVMVSELVKASEEFKKYY